MSPVETRRGWGMALLPGGAPHTVRQHAYPRVRVQSHPSPKRPARSPPRAAGAAESLERRALLSGVVVGVTPGSTGAGLHIGTVTEAAGGAVMVREYGTALSIGPPSATAAAAGPAAAGPAAAFDIVLNKGPNLRNNPAAAAAFEQAAAFFESIFFDRITVVLDVEIAPLGTTVLGGATPVYYGGPFDLLRDAIVEDADPLDEGLVARLPREAAFLGILPDSNFTLEGMIATRANLLAVGFDAAQLTGNTYSEYATPPNSVLRDAKIVLSSDYPFDYDRGDGIGPGLHDFVGVVLHQIAHTFGFVSIVDDVDRLFDTSAEVAATPLDLFRLEPGVGAADFTGGARVLSPGAVVASQVFYDGGLFDPAGITSIPGLTRGDIPVSTGARYGDGYFAEHWKSNSLIGAANTIGAMDPTTSAGLRVNWTDADERALALIGWDTAPAPLPRSISGLVYGDSNGDGSYQPGLGERGLGGVTVYHDENNNGQFDRGFYTQSAPPADLPVPILDFATINSTILVQNLPGVVRDVDVTVYIEHPYTFDLDAWLISPGGRRVLLFEGPGEEDEDGRSMNFTGTIIDDEAHDFFLGGLPPFTGRFRPAASLSRMDGAAMNGTWTLQVKDYSALDEGMLLDWSVTFETGTGRAEPSAVSGPDGAYALTRIPVGSYRMRQVPIDGHHQTQPAANGAYVFDLARGEQVTGLDFGQAAGAPAASVIGRHLFYNRSAYDGGDPAADARDDDAIAADKRALPAGATATPDNVTNYARGINGIMIDVAGLPRPGSPGPGDFLLEVGGPGGWLPIGAPPAVTVRPGAGASGTDRVTLILPDGSARNTWLRVTVKTTTSTGLAAPDVFYFGNLTGETGDSTAGGALTVTAIDFLRTRRAQGAPYDPRYDFNRDGRVSPVDLAIVRSAQRRSLALLNTPSPSPPPLVVPPGAARREDTSPGAEGISALLE